MNLEGRDGGGGGVAQEKKKERKGKQSQNDPLTIKGFENQGGDV